MANPYRTTVTIDGQKFQAVTTSVKFNTEKDRSGVAQMGSLSTKIRVWADLHDDVNLPFGTVKHLFDLANVVTRDKIKPIKIEFWKDDSQQDALISYSFNGWIRRFETSNPLGLSSQVAGVDQRRHPGRRRRPDPESHAGAGPGARAESGQLRRCPLEQLAVTTRAAPGPQRRKDQSHGSSLPQHLHHRRAEIRLPLHLRFFFYRQGSLRHAPDGLAGDHDSRLC